MTRSSKRLIAALLLGAAPMLSGGAPAGAQTAAPQADASPRAYVERVSAEAFTVLRNAGLSEAQKADQFQAILQRNFAVKAIGRRVLGNYGRQATPQQLAAYDAAFPRYMIGVYQSRLADYKNTTLKVVGTQNDPSNPAIQLVRSVASGGGLNEPVQVDWTIRKGANGYQFIDLYVEGVSLVVTQQADFAARIDQAGNAQKGIDQLIDLMKRSAVQQSAAR